MTSSYDAFGRPVIVTEADGGVTTMSYNGVTTQVPSQKAAARGAMTAL